ncbi:FxsA family protein [Jannaschia sp. M317]|uniref:FxsA family protein n=1 Tax=Jannaschia sp. M317 TaxID=2867011 RepID=UPI0021A38111|nr:FxsA family protein [Jannaschia sp. M317]UWQ18326.1 FxsA family protein [Jannaschia sp. M317]
MWLLALFILVPLLEIGLFIQVGGWLGLWPTLAIVLATAVLGTHLVRKQGLEQIQKVQSSFNELNDPTRPLAHGAMILASGLLLLTPGFFTDAVGFALLVPAVRDAVMEAVRKRIKVQSFTMGGQAQQPHDPYGRGQPDDTVIDADYVEMPPRKGPSGWTEPRD